MWMLNREGITFNGFRLVSIQSGCDFGINTPLVIVTMCNDIVVAPREFAAHTCSWGHLHLRPQLAAPAHSAQGVTVLRVMCPEHHSAQNITVLRISLCSENHSCLGVESGELRGGSLRVERVVHTC